MFAIQIILEDSVPRKWISIRHHDKVTKHKEKKADKSAWYYFQYYNICCVYPPSNTSVLYD
jgi:hypothetical protein